MLGKILRKPFFASEKNERFANLKTANFHASSFGKKEKEKGKGNRTSVSKRNNVLIKEIMFSGIKPSF